MKNKNFYINQYMSNNHFKNDFNSKKDKNSNSSIPKKTIPNIQKILEEVENELLKKCQMS